MEENNSDTGTKRPRQGDWREIIRCLTLSTHVGFVMVGSIFAGLFLGLVLDKLVGTGLWGIIIMIGTGIAAGFYNVYRHITRILE